MSRSKDEMTIVEHLVEFRRRFIAVVLCFFLVFCITLLFAGELYAYLTRGFDKPLLVLGPNDILWIYINLASLMAFTVTLPFTTYQIWQFIKPGLRDNEARAIFAYIPATFVCFVLGLAFGYYFVSPAILEVLLKLGEGLFDTQITAQNYLSFLLHTTVPLAVLFELPVVVSFLTSIGIITPVFLTRYRRYAYFILLVLAVVLTPADFISDLAMTAPLILLYEVSVTLSKLIYKRKQRKYKDK
ncbi:twin-arginine translocase subunit TatC [Streptococcus salivarius]|uniref:twin-arginine translocase subunit TatC n=1 Tax=Streptococcus salivarius TaxID=1304 RepID=UPI002C29FA74|nr:twin-arginine translocase subunit TatC [Streptococcus salivarius]MEB3643987.1 twin-arginine translocase subunit TatC [Streptococcus salivarius]